MRPPRNSARKLSPRTVKPAETSSPFAASWSIIVRKLSMNETGEIGSCGLCSGERAAQRPSSWIAGSNKYPHSVSS